ncbi:MAG TPA: hypothetical protein VIM11_04795 [Tepidisphaeraceae bacterium]|jgi:hypothetical protein
MHIEVTPSGKLVGKAIRRVLGVALYGIPIALIFVLLAYGVSCARSVANALFGHSQSNVYSNHATPTPTPVSTPPLIAQTHILSRPIPLAAPRGGNVRPVDPTPVPTEIVDVEPLRPSGSGPGPQIAARPADVVNVNAVEVHSDMFLNVKELPSHTLARDTDRHDEATSRPAAPVDHHDRTTVIAPTPSRTASGSNRNREQISPKATAPPINRQPIANRGGKPATQPSKSNDAARTHPPVTPPPDPKQRSRGAQPDHGGSASGSRRGTVPPKQGTPAPDANRRPNGSDGRDR